MMVLMASFTQFLSSIVVQKTFISTLLDSISIRVTSKALNYSGKETDPTQSSRANIKLIHGLTSQTHILPFGFDKFFFSPAVPIFSVWQIESLSICEPFTMALSLWLVHDAWWVSEVDSFVFDFKSTALFLNHRRSTRVKCQRMQSGVNSGGAWGAKLSSVQLTQDAVEYIAVTQRRTETDNQRDNTHCGYRYQTWMQTNFQPIGCSVIAITLSYCFSILRYTSISLVVHPIRLASNNDMQTMMIIQSVFAFRNRHSNSIFFLFSLTFWSAQLERSHANHQRGIRTKEIWLKKWKGT